MRVSFCKIFQLKASHKERNMSNLRETKKAYVCTIYINIYTHTHICTGHFITYSGITKIYYRKTVGHVFTKPVQIEGKTKKFSPQLVFFIVVHISAARRCECM